MKNKLENQLLNVVKDTYQTDEFKWTCMKEKKNYFIEMKQMDKINRAYVINIGGDMETLNFQKLISEALKELRSTEE